MTKLNLSYKSSVDVAILNGKSHLSLHNVVKTQYNIKKLQKAIRQYAKRMNSEVSTHHDKLYDELVITRKRFDTAKDYLPGVVAEVIGTKVPIIHNVATPLPSMPPVETQKPNTLPYEFKVGDNGKTACGEKYVVLEKDSQLLVNIKNRGVWKFGLRNLDGTCVYNYPNKHKFALIPPEKQLPVIQKRTIYVNVYKNYAYSHPTQQQAIEGGDRNTAIAIAVPVTFEFTPLR